MMMDSIGFVTIGQSPRTDVVPYFRRIIPEEYAILEAGALDGLTRNEIEKNFRPEENDVLYVSRMRDGSQIKFSRKKMLPLMEKQIQRLDDNGVSLIVVLCSGEFPDYGTKAPIIFPEKVLKSFASIVSYRGKTGIVVPIEEQIDYAKKKWGMYFTDLTVVSVSPYRGTTGEFVKAGAFLREKGVKMVIMDCMGFTEEQRNLLKSEAKSNVICTRTAVGKVLMELLS